MKAQNQKHNSNVRFALCSQSAVTWRLTSLVVDVQSSSFVHSGHHLVVGAVEAVDPDHTGLRLHVSIFGVGGIQIVLKYSQSVQVLDLKENRKNVFHSLKDLICLFQL